MSGTRLSYPQNNQWGRTMNSTISKVYAAIAGIPLAAILIASAVSGGSSSNYEGYDMQLDAARAEASGGFAGSGKTEAEAYESLGKYNPCIFIACEGE